MKKVDERKVSGIHGGNPAIYYPLAGCVTVTAMDYAKSEDMTYGDMCCSCAKGAIHGANMGMGITAPIGNQYVRYVAGMAYGRYAPALVDNFVRNSRAVAMRRQGNSTFLGGFSD